MMKVAGIRSEKEAVKFLLGKVGDLHMKNYMSHLWSEARHRNSSFATVPAILAFEYPAGKQILNDSGDTQSGEAFFEVKWYQANNIRYNHNNIVRKPTDRRAIEVTNKYSNKFKKLDKEYAPDVVGDGSKGIVEPFESAQNQYVGGQVIPLVVGAFGETNKDFEIMMKRLAKLAAAGEDGIISTQFGQESSI